MSFPYSPKVGAALIPTMMVQPLPKNALMHRGNARDHFWVNADAFTRRNTLAIQNQDNGLGMGGQTTAKPLSGAHLWRQPLKQG